MDENKVNSHNDNDDDLDILVNKTREMPIVPPAVKRPQPEENPHAPAEPKTPVQKRKIPLFPKEQQTKIIPKANSEPHRMTIKNSPAEQDHACLTQKEQPGKTIPKMNSENNHMPVKNSPEEQAHTVPPKEPKDNDGNDKNQPNRKGNGIVSGITKALLYIAFVLCVSGVISYFGIIYANDIFALVKDDVTADVVVEANATVAELADILHSEKLINHPGIFKFYTWYRNRKNEDGVELIPGTYKVSAAMNYDMMLSMMKKQKVKRTIVTLTFKEGLTADETIKIFTDAGIGTREGFIDAINNYDYDYQFVKLLDNWKDNKGRKYRLEGYLFPDTYDFYTDSDESFVLGKLLSNFNRKFEEEYYDRCKALGYTVDEIINIASLIEKEGYLPEDLENISSVFHNRLSNWQSPLLQSDATIQYSFETRKKKLTREDLQIDTPYNTYLYKGLPPSAIANPSLESIMAAMYPAKSNYYYFVSRKSGAAIFSRTLEEHNRAVTIVQNEPDEIAAESAISPATVEDNDNTVEGATN